LFAALEIAAGQVTGVSKPRHRHRQFLILLRHLARAYPRPATAPDHGQLHRPETSEGEGLAHSEPRIHIHFTPTSGSWLNLVEVWFSIIERQAIHRGAFPSVRDLMIQIRTFINGWNDRCQPFVWTKTADQILTKANRKTTSVAVHWETQPRLRSNSPVKVSEDVVVVAARNACSSVDLVLALYPTLAAVDVDRV
jgi:hypothetical protein